MTRETVTAVSVLSGERRTELVRAMRLAFDGAYLDDDGDGEDAMRAALAVAEPVLAAKVREAVLREVLGVVDREIPRAHGGPGRSPLWDGGIRKGLRIVRGWLLDQLGVEREVLVKALAAHPVPAPEAPGEGKAPGEPLTFEAFSEINRRRCESYNGFGESLQPSSKYTLAHWALSIASEAGEVCDAILGFEGLKARRAGKTSLDIAKEMADVITYCDLAIQKLGYQTGAVVAEKFEEVNARGGFGRRFAIRGAAPATPTCATCDDSRIVNAPQPSGYPHAFPCPECRPDEPCSCKTAHCPGPKRVAEWKAQRRAAPTSEGGGR